MKKTIATIFTLMLAIASLHAKPADPKLLSRLLAEGDTLRYTQMLISEQAERTLTHEMLQKRAASTRHNDIGGSEIVNLSPRGLVILVNFSDLAMTKLDHASADSMFNGSAYHYGGAYGSVQQYFSDQSNGAYVPEFTIVGPVTLAHEHDYYGTNSENSYSNGNDQYNADLVIEACLLAEEQGVDFSLFDHNNDGEVDFVYIIYAGTGEADSGKSTDIWPKSGQLSSLIYYGMTNQEEYNWWNRLQLDGKVIENFACSNELDGRHRDRDGIGTICHEYSHVIGLPDIYDSRYGTNYQQGLTPGQWSLMDAGSYNNDGITPPNFAAWDKYFCGWITPEELKNARDITLPIGDAYYIAGALADVRPTSQSTIYYVENRQQQGWDQYLPGHGMIIWQVTFNRWAWEYNTVNTDDLKYCMVGHTSYPGKSDIGVVTPMDGCTISKIREISDTILFRFKEGDGTLFEDCERYSWTPKYALSNGMNALGDYLWNISSNQETFGFKGLVGATIGSATSPSTTFSLSSNSSEDCTPSEVVIIAKCPGASITAEIGGTALGTQTLRNDKQTCTFTNPDRLSGEIHLTMSNVTTIINLYGLQVNYDQIEEAIEDNQAPHKSEKYLLNGRLYLRVGDKVYDMSGQSITSK